METPSWSMGLCRCLRDLPCWMPRGAVIGEKGVGCDWAPCFSILPHPPQWGGLDLNSSNRGCARLGSEVAPSLRVVKEEVAVLIVLVRRHRRAVGAAVRRAVDDEVPRVIFQCPRRFPWATREGRARQGRGAERCGGRCGGRTTERGAGIGLRGTGGARLPRLATTATAAVFVQLTLR